MAAPLALSTTSPGVEFDAKHLIKLCDAFADPKQQHNLVAVTAEVAKSIWVQAVSGEQFPPMGRPLYSDEYAAAIMDPDNTRWRGELDVTVSAASFRGAAAIEDGSEPFDMKPGFLRSAKAKRGKSGLKYLDIPFRHGTPGKPADGPNPDRASFATTMPPAIYALAKQLEANTGQRLGNVGPVRTKPQVGGMQGPYTHKASIWAGMQKKQNRSGTRYQTFRRISEKSAQDNPDSWWHPATEPLPIMQAVMQELDRRLPAVMAAFLQVIGQDPGV